MQDDPPFGPQGWFYLGLERAAAAACDPRETPRAAAAEAAATADQLTALSPQRALRACSVGCTACCSFVVGVSVPEVLSIVAELDTLSASETAGIRERVRAAATESAAWTWEDQASRRRVCPLLDAGGRCTVYSVRPIACRSWCSTSRQACEDGFAMPGGDVDGAAYLVGLGVHAALAAAAGGQTFELTSALARALAEADVPERWQRGEDVFRDCKRANE